MDAMQILVIILSITLAVFLILAIILTIMLIRVTVQIQRMADTAENAVDNLSRVAASASKLISPLALSKLIFGKFRKSK